MTELEKSEYLDKLYRITGAGMKVYNEIGYGYSEPIYQECLSIECERSAIPWEREKLLKMYYKGQMLKNEYKADFVCFGNVITEIKAVSFLNSEHRAQLFNYLRITQSKAGVLINFCDSTRFIAENYMLDEESNHYLMVSPKQLLRQTSLY
jgi:GxxExxY protein